jgi:nitrate/nitrite-specific signal transduction histidine kinase
MNTAQEVGHGQLDAKIDVNSSDEIGELAQAFNQMTAKLKQSRAEIAENERDLENQVKNRTKELEVSKIELETKVEELEKFNRVAVERELKMIELKKKIKEIEDERKPT